MKSSLTLLILALVWGQLAGQDVLRWLSPLPEGPSPNQTTILPRQTLGPGGDLILTRYDQNLMSGSTGGLSCLRRMSRLSGQLLWERCLDPDIYIVDLSSDAQGDIYTCGIFAGLRDFDPDPSRQFLLGQAGHVSIAQPQYFIAKYNGQTGDLIWAHRLNLSHNGSWGALNGLFFQLHWHPSGRLILAGNFNAPSDFGTMGQFVPRTLYSSRSVGSLFVAAYQASNGAFDWISVLDGKGYQYFRDIKIDAQGDIILGGSFRDSLDINPGAARQWLHSPNQAGLLLKLNAQGFLLWGFALSGDGDNYVSALQPDAQGRIWVAGTMFSSQVDFDPSGNLALRQGLQNQQHRFLARYRANGSFELAQVMGRVQSSDLFLQEWLDLALGPNNELLALGAYDQGFNLGLDGRPAPSLSPGLGAFVLRYDAQFNYLNHQVFEQSFTSDYFVRTGRLLSDTGRGLWYLGLSSAAMQTDFDPNPQVAYRVSQQALPQQYTLAAYGSCARHLPQLQALSQVRCFPNDTFSLSFSNSQDSCPLCSYELYGFNSPDFLRRRRGEGTWSWDSTGQYFLRLGHCPQTSVPIDLREAPAVALQAVPNQNLCPGSSLTWQVLGAQAGASYVWSDGSTASLWTCQAPCTAIVTYRDPQTQCPQRLEDSVLTNAQPLDARFSAQGGQRQFCQGGTNVRLIPLVSGGQFIGPVNGDWLLVSQLPPGSYPITYRLQGTQGCVYEHSDTFLISSNIQPNTGWPSLQSFCTNDSARFFQGQPSGGIWELRSTLSGQVLQFPDPYFFNPASWQATAGDSLRLSYYYQNPNGCTGEWHGSIRIQPSPQIQAQALRPAYCQGGSAVALQALPLGGQWMSNQAHLGNLNAAQGLYTPQQVTAAWERLTYEYTHPQTGCRAIYRDSTRVISSGLQLAWAQALPQGLCRNGDSLLLQAAPAPGPGEQAFFSASWSGALLQQQGNQSLWRFNQVPDSLPFIVLRYHYVSALGCEQILSDTLTLRPRPQLSLSLSRGGRQTCMGYAADTLLLQASVGGQWLGLQGLGLQGQAPSYLWAHQGLNPGRYGFCGSYRDQWACTWSFCDSLELLANPQPLLSGLRSRYCSRSAPDTLIALPLGGQWMTNANGALLPALQGQYAVWQPSLVPSGMTQAWVRYRATQANGCVNEVEQRVDIVPPPSFQWQQPLVGSSWCSNQAWQALNIEVNGQVNPSTGQFFERDLLSGQLFSDSLRLPQGRWFNPAVVGNRQLAYIFSDPISGCQDTSLMTVSVQASPQVQLQGLQAVYCPDSQGDTLRLLPGLAPGATVQHWQYSLASGRTLPQLTGMQAWLNPASLSVGLDTVLVLVRDNQGCETELRRGFSIGNFPTDVRIINAQARYCAETGLHLVQAQPSGAGGRFRLRNTAGIVQDSSIGNTWIFDSRQHAPGAYSLSYEFRDNLGCAARDTVAFSLHPRPRAAYTQLNYCAGDSIRLQDQSQISPLFAADTLSQWQWFYRGQFMGQGRQQAWRFEQADWGSLQLFVQTGAGCRDTLQGDTLRVYSRPSLRLQSAGGCQGDSLWVHSDSLQIQPILRGLPLDNLRSAEWTWLPNQSQSQNLSANPSRLAAAFVYPQAGAYTLRLRLDNAGFCQVEDSLRVLVSPKIELRQGDYIEDYSRNAGTVLADRPNSPWQWGDLLGQRLDFDFPLWSLHRGLPYQGGDTARLYLPCVVLSPLDRPMIELDWQADLYDFDGLALEYYDQDSELWRPLGERGRGRNWYNNSSPLFGLFNIQDLSTGTRLEGFTGRQLSWQNSRYALDEYRSEAPLRLRLSFGSLSGVPNTEQREGFALRRLALRQRQCQALFELFSNSQAPGMAAWQQQIYQFLGQQHWRRDLVFCQYPTANSGPDALYVNSRIPGSNSRLLYYGARDKDLYINGVYLDPALMQAARLEQEILDDADFELHIENLHLAQGRIHWTAHLRALRNLPEAEYSLQALALEDSILADGRMQYRILDRFIPEPGGQMLRRSFRRGDSLSLSLSAPLPLGEQDPDLWLSRIAAGFIQRESDKKVLQVAQTRNFRWALGTGLVASPDLDPAAAPIELLPYPNPARELVWIKGKLPLGCTWQLFDLQGRLLSQGNNPEAGIRLNPDWPTGSYILRLQQKDLGQTWQWQLIKWGN